MASFLASPKVVLTALVPILVAYLYGPSIQRAITIQGLFHKLASTPTASPDDFVVIDDTVHCEDLHYYAPANSIFTACEDTAETRFSWFPPLANFGDPVAAMKAQGSIHVVDVVTKKSRRLTLDNFSGPFVTHGIDIIPDPDTEDSSAVYIFAVNHVPHPDYLTLKRHLPDAETEVSSAPLKAASRIEVFHHTLGSSSARHIRTVQHPLITTPNDILAASPTDFYVTNDHRHREGLLRTVEDLYTGATWSTATHVRLGGDDGGDDGDDDDGAVVATVALRGVHNNNGLGHGARPGDVLLGSCMSGVLHLGEISGGGGIHLVDAVSVDSVVDNPSYFADPFAEDPEGDRSGYVLPGITRALDIAKAIHDPEGRNGAMVWYVRKAEDGAWQKRLLFEDDGDRLRTVSAAALVAIDPKYERGERRAWLFATGFLAKNMVAVKVDL